MCRRMPFLCVLAVVVAAVVFIHHARQLKIDGVAATPLERDPAIALREMSHASTPDKRWLTDDDQADGDTRLIVGHSRKPATSEQEALRDARRDVQSHVHEIVNDEIGSARLNHAYLAARVSTDVMTGRFEVDRIAEKFDRPYGRVWTESVLVDFSPEKLQPALAGYQQEYQSHQKAIHARWVGFAALSILVLFGYGLSNMLTRGYFTGWLRIMTLVVLVLGAFALI
jgi:hypothetical protein